MSAIRVGPARVSSRESPEGAIRLLVERNYTACEIDCEGGFWMGYPFAERFARPGSDDTCVRSYHLINNRPICECSLVAAVSTDEKVCLGLRR